MSIDYAMEEIKAIERILNSLAQSQKLHKDDHETLQLHLDILQQWLGNGTRPFLPIGHDDTCSCFDCWKFRYRTKVV